MKVDASTTRKVGFVVLGNQLFPLKHLQEHKSLPFFMAEDMELCTFVRHHKQKIALFLSSMRSYRDALQAARFHVSYVPLDGPIGHSATYEDKLLAFVKKHELTVLRLWEVEDKFFEQRLKKFAEQHEVKLEWGHSPMFLTPREDFGRWLGQDRSPMMANFYAWQRKRLGILVTKKRTPVGGKWSFDANNRQALPRKQPVTETVPAKPTQHVRDVIPLVHTHFADHPGDLTEAGWWLPSCREQAERWLEAFLNERFALFGPYEDAISGRGAFLFHSVLTPALNLGWLTPDEVLSKAMEAAQENDVPINSTEGFVRQIIGWREFVRGVYQHFSEEQEQGNFFGHQRSLTPHWYRGSTGLPPLDDVIRKAQRLGWTHHIERLMIAGNLMLLCEIEPVQTYRWFMEMYVDSSDWVMVPNVLGMSLFADGGIFATKPYICGSNYILKMSDYKKPPQSSSGDTWCDVMDGLYWRFIEKHKPFFGEQARLGHAVSLLERMDTAHRKKIMRAANAFLDEATA